MLRGNIMNERVFLLPSVRLSLPLNQLAGTDLFSPKPTSFYRGPIPFGTKGKEKKCLKAMDQPYPLNFLGLHCNFSLPAWHPRELGSSAVKTLSLSAGNAAGKLTAWVLDLSTVQRGEFALLPQFLPT